MDNLINPSPGKLKRIVQGLAVLSSVAGVGVILMVEKGASRQLVDIGVFATFGLAIPAIVVFVRDAYRGAP